MRAKLGGDIAQQPLPPDEPIFQVRPDRREAKLDDPLGDPLLGMAASLQRQPLRPGWQHDAQRFQHLGDSPVADAKFSGEPGNAVAGVTACR